MHQSVALPHRGSFATSPSLCTSLGRKYGGLQHSLGTSGQPWGNGFPRGGEIRCEMGWREGFYC